MAKLSVSVPDDLLDELRALASENVSAFVTAAIRQEVDRRRLYGFLDELDSELGPVDEEQVGYFMDVFAESARQAQPAVGSPAAKRARRAGQPRAS